MEQQNSSVPPAMPPSSSEQSVQSEPVASPSIVSESSLRPDGYKVGLALSIVALLIGIGAMISGSVLGVDTRGRVLEVQETMASIDTGYNDVNSQLETFIKDLNDLSMRAGELEEIVQAPPALKAFALQSYSSGFGYDVKIPSNSVHAEHVDTPEKRYDRFDGKDALFDVVIKEVPGELSEYRYMDADHVGSYVDSGFDGFAYVFEDGVCDSDGCTDPLVAIVARLNDNDVVHFRFIGNTILSTVEEIILQSIVIK